MNRLLIYIFFLTIFTSVESKAQNQDKQPGYYRLKIGVFEVVALSDGTVPVDAHKLLHPEDPQITDQLLAESFIENAVETSINAYLIKAANKLILIDTGAGELFGPDHGGKLIESLKSVGYSPEQISDILLTHIHLDHSGGLIIKGREIFPNATIHVNKKELDFWSQHEIGKISGDTNVNTPAFDVLKPYIQREKVKTFEGNTTLFPGISTLEYFGHTPGHTVYVLESGKEKILFWGDLIHIAAIQLKGPEFPNDYDTDKSKAAAQRQKAYEDAAKNGYLIAADHISFPGFGRIRTSSKGFDFVPVTYSVLNRTK